MQKLNILDLKKELEKKRITQKELAKITGIRFPTISEYCNNSWKTISRSNIKKISKTLNKRLIIDIAEDNKCK